MLDRDLLVDIRRENLRSIAKDLGGPAKLAEKTGKSEGQISHLIGVNAHKPVGEKLAREFEKACQKPDGWLDRVHNVNDTMLREVSKAVDEIAKSEKLKLTSERRDELISLCYLLVAQHDGDKSLLRKVVKLSRKDR